MPQKNIDDDEIFDDLATPEQKFRVLVQRYNSIRKRLIALAGGDPDLSSDALTKLFMDQAETNKFAGEMRPLRPEILETLKLSADLRAMDAKGLLEYIAEKRKKDTGLRKLVLTTVVGGVVSIFVTAFTVLLQMLTHTTGAK